MIEGMPRSAGQAVRCSSLMYPSILRDAQLGSVDSAAPGVMQLSTSGLSVHVLLQALPRLFASGSVTWTLPV